MAKSGGRRRGATDRRVPSGTVRQYPRAARVNEVLRQVLAEAIERIADADERLDLLTITAVTSDPELRHATVLFASLNDEARAGLVDHRLRLQGVIAGQVRLKRTPQLAFQLDPAVATGARVEEILRNIRSGDHQGERDE